MIGSVGLVLFWKEMEIRCVILFFLTDEKNGYLSCESRALHGLRNPVEEVYSDGGKERNDS
jgi:hypothetical protein